MGFEPKRTSLCDKLALLPLYMAIDQITSYTWRKWSSVWLTDRLRDVVYVIKWQETLLGREEAPERLQMIAEQYNKCGH